MSSLKDEIKEILDYLNKFINDKEEITKYGCEISVKNAKLLLDYITNLQKENKKLKHNLKQMYNDTKDTYNEICAEQIDYKARNEKAIDHIKENICYDEVVCSVCNILLNILQGSDKDE